MLMIRVTSVDGELSFSETVQIMPATITIDLISCCIASYGAIIITSKIKHAIKLKTSPARYAQLLQPSLAFCFSLQPMTLQLQGRCAVIGCMLKQNANESCNSCASLAGLVLSFIACFILLVITPLVVTL